ncbi:MAG: hypothetical protein AAF922_03345 [Pseudomonadota bacterium]
MIHERQLTRPILELLNDTKAGELTTTDLRLELKQRLKLQQSDLMPLESRPDTRIDQVIRNVKSHKKQSCNPFYEGLLEDVPRGFRITDKGRQFLKQTV